MFLIWWVLLCKVSPVKLVFWILEGGEALLKPLQLPMMVWLEYTGIFVVALQPVLAGQQLVKYVVVTILVGILTCCLVDSSLVGAVG